MNTKRLIFPTIAAVLLAAGQVVAAQEAPSTPSDSRVIAVIVEVDNHGKVTNVSPDVNLQPALDNLLRQTLQRMITKPAHDSHGNAMASQMVMQLSMQSTQLADGTYNAKFGYLKARPLPMGQHYAWRRLHNGQHPALVQTGPLSDNTQANRARMQMADDRSIAKGVAAQQQRQAQQTQSQSQSGGSH